MTGTEETRRHIARVQFLLADFAQRLLDRAEVHDASKLESPEAEAFAKAGSLLGCSYGSPEYHQGLAALGPALAHHYAHNSHHPEHYGADGIRGMSLLDLVEMFIDWKAASERHATGDILRSIAQNYARFGFSEDLRRILLNTAWELGYAGTAAVAHAAATGCTHATGPESPRSPTPSEAAAGPAEGPANFGAPARRR
jgi:Family of unknown function (DUF5662)